jgi:hypothetical protein
MAGAVKAQAKYGEPFQEKGSDLHLSLSEEFDGLAILLAPSHLYIQ